MPDDKAMYFMLFNAISDAIEGLNANRSLSAVCWLVRAQRRTEEMRIAAGDSPHTVL